VISILYRCISLRVCVLNIRNGLGREKGSPRGRYSSALTHWRGNIQSLSFSKSQPAHKSAVH